MSVHTSALICGLNDLKKILVTLKLKPKTFCNADLNSIFIRKPYFYFLTDQCIVFHLQAVQGIVSWIWTKSKYNQLQWLFTKYKLHVHISLLVVLCYTATTTAQPLLRNNIIIFQKNIINQYITISFIQWIGFNLYLYGLLKIRTISTKTC